MSVPGPVLGPCESWITGADVAACCSIEGASSSEADALLEEVAVEASMLLYELSGRLFSGLCETTVRPCRAPCHCWVPDERVFAEHGGGWWGGWSWGDGAWSHACGDRCGCGQLSQIKLAGYPIREITEVLIDGSVVDPTTYRLDRSRYLVRLDDAGPPLVKRRWPACQNLALDEGPTTFFISYTFGTDPPPGAIRAAAELACELYRSCPGIDGECALPTNVTRVDRQGITIDRKRVTTFLAGAETGLFAVDAFLAVYGGRRRRAAIWSPDVPPFPRRVG